MILIVKDKNYIIEEKREYILRDCCNESVAWRHSKDFAEDWKREEKIKGRKKFEVRYKIRCGSIDNQEPLTSFTSYKRLI
ncbi:MAG: hypothetical protein ABIJ28_03920 [Patescibacteria group bacterium]